MTAGGIDGFVSGRRHPCGFLGMRLGGSADSRWAIVPPTWAEVAHSLPQVSMRRKPRRTKIPEIRPAANSDECPQPRANFARKMAQQRREGDHRRVVRAEIRRRRHELMAGFARRPRWKAPRRARFRLTPPDKAIMLPACLPRRTQGFTHQDIDHRLLERSRQIGDGKPCPPPVAACRAPPFSSPKTKNPNARRASIERGKS